MKMEATKEKTFLADLKRKYKALKKEYSWLWQEYKRVREMYNKDFTRLVDENKSKK